MIRRLLSIGLVSSLILACSQVVAAAPPTSSPGLMASVMQPTASPRDLVEMTGHAALRYSDDLTPSQVALRAREDAERLGFPLVKTMVVGNVAVLQGSRADVETRLREVENLPVKEVRPVYSDGRNVDPASLLVYTDVLALTFDPATTEAAKQRFIREQGLVYLRETASGRTLVRRPGRADASNAQYARSLRLMSPIVKESLADVLFTAEPTANSTAITVNDPFFERFQWYLWNSPQNTNYGFGKADEDIDSPLAWSINQNNSQSANRSAPFGRASVVVGVFDSGVQITHEDLAQNIDTRVGFDVIDEGQPTPPATVLGAHGTAMAGLVAATRNNVGIVGTAPGVSIYASRVLGEDFSGSAAGFTAALEDAVFKNVDVGLHAYALAVTLDNAIVEAMEGSFRVTLESGRAGRGMTHLAATGNFAAQVEYPASSIYTIGVSSITSEGNIAYTANWGGVGPDISMPANGLTVNRGFPTDETGIVTTDISGVPGLGLPDPFTAGNQSGNYGAIGGVVGFTSSNASGSSEPYGGTSVSAALAAGVVALMYSDPRYTDLAPLDLSGEELEGQQTLEPFNDGVPQNAARAAWRTRGPSRRSLPGTNIPRTDMPILSMLRSFADLSGPVTLGGESFDQFLRSVAQDVYTSVDFLPHLNYIGQQYNERLGFGRPNAARVMAPWLTINTDEGTVPFALYYTPDSAHETLIEEPPIYEATFGLIGNSGDSLNEEKVDALAQGWRPATGQSISASLTASAPPIIISPFLEGVRALYFEDGGTLRPEGDDEFFYVWTDSVTTAPQGSDVQDSQRVISNFQYNPDGRYWGNRPVGLVSPGIPVSSPTIPMILTVQLAHELGGEDGSQARTNNQSATMQPEVDFIQVSFVAQVGESTLKVPVGIITGDSTPNRKTRLSPATGRIFPQNTTNVVPAWESGRTRYFPYVPDDQMIIRTYRFMVPPLPADVSTGFIQVELQPNDSHLPEYKITNNNGVITYDQIYDVRRDMKGFIFYSAKLNYLNRIAIPDRYGRGDFQVGDGFLPVWSASKNDIIATQSTFFGGDQMVRFSPYPDVYRDPTTAEGVTASIAQPYVAFMESFDAITGMKSHPTVETIALTTRGVSQDNLYLITNDGINQRELISPSLTTGARDPNWAINGNQLLFAGPDYVRLVNFQADGSREVETIIDASNSWLTDFRTPLFDRNNGFIIVSARRKDIEGSALNIYMLARNGRIISVGRDSVGGPLPLLRGWDGVDVYDMDQSPNGNRVMFVANASQVPEYDADGSVLVPAIPSENSQVFLWLNLEETADRGANPVVARPALINRDDPSYTVSARWPRFAPNGREIAYVGYQGPANVNTTTDGRVIRQPIPPEVNRAPTDPPPTRTPPPPTPTPTATPVVDNALVAKVGETVFRDDSEGWTFNPAGYIPPTVGRFESAGNTPREINPGLVSFAAFSPNVVASNGTTVATLRFVAVVSGTSSVNLVNDPPRRSLVQDRLGNNLPTQVSAKGVTTLDAKGIGTAQLYSSPNSLSYTAGQQVIVRVFLDPNGQPAQIVEGYLAFDPNQLRFDSGTVNATIFTNQIDRGWLNINSNGNTNVFGFWSSPTTSIEVRPDSLYLVRSSISSRRGIPASQVPTLRMRVNSRNFESAFTQETNSYGDLSLSPNVETRKKYDLLFQPPSGLFELPPTEWRYTLALDLLNFLSDKSSLGGFELYDVEIFRLDQRESHVALYGFSTDFNMATGQFIATSRYGVEGRLTLDLRTDPFNSATSVRCATGSAANGVVLNLRDLNPGNYTLVVVSERPTDVEVFFTSTTPLAPVSNVACAFTVEPISGQVAQVCLPRTGLSGTGSLDNAVVATTVYEGRSVLQSATCSAATGTAAKTLRPVYTADFSDASARNEWVQGPGQNAFSYPNFGITSTGITLAATDRNQTFGFWNAEGETIPRGDVALSPSSPVLVYRATFRVNNETEANTRSVPDLRFRLSTNDFQRSVSGLLISNQSGVTVPGPGDPKELVLYMVLEQVPTSFTHLIAAFDILAFYPAASFPGRTVTTAPIELRLVRIERVDIPNYPSISTE